MQLLTHLKRMTVISSAVFALTVQTPSYADAAADAAGMQLQANGYLQQIANNTYNALEKINNLPIYLDLLTRMAISWNTQETGDNTPISNTQEHFALLGYWFNQEEEVQKSLQLNVASELFLFPPMFFSMPGIIAASIPNANDLSYGTVLGAPPVAKAPGTAYNYMRYAAALNYTRPFPNSNWAGPDDAKQKYTNYYNTVTAIQSYSGYVLSKMVAENINNNPITTQQKILVDQASNSNWISQIGTEELGKVLREILLYQSQSYVLLNQMLKTEKELLSSMVMTNSLLIVFSQTNNEKQLLDNAMNPPPA